MADCDIAELIGCNPQQVKNKFQSMDGYLLATVLVNLLGGASGSGASVPGGETIINDQVTEHSCVDSVTNGGSGVGTQTFPCLVDAIALTVNAGAFDLSFDNGVTWPVTYSAGDSGFSLQSGNGKPIDLTNFRVRSNAISGDIGELVWRS